MIDLIAGQIADRTNDSLTVMVGGIGVKVFVPKTVLERIKGSSIELFTHLVVREDALTLFGFQNKEERHIFETLLKVQGGGASAGIGNSQHDEH